MVFMSTTGMAFLDDSGNNIIVIEKEDGVKLISEGILHGSFKAIGRQF